MLTFYVLWLTDNVSIKSVKKQSQESLHIKSAF